MIPKRSEIDSKYKWDLTAMYTSDQEWEEEFVKLQKVFPDIFEFRGKLNNAESLGIFLSQYMWLLQIQENLFVYSSMRFFEDTTNNFYEEMKGRIGLFMSDMGSKLVFVDKELSGLTNHQLDSLLKENTKLKQYCFFLESYARHNPHILSEETEAALSEIGIALNKSDDIFSAFNDTNIKFEDIEHNGEKFPLSHALYSKYLESPDREFRRKAFESYYTPYLANVDVLANTYAATILASTKMAKIRKFDSSLERSLFSDFLKRSILDNLVNAAKEGVGVLSEFNQLRKEELNIEDLHIYDNYVPLVSLEKEFTYEETAEVTRKSVEILGEEYLNQLDAAVNANVIDVCESQGKRSGAFSWGSYLSRGYVFLNYAGKTRDIFTYAHEFGHCIHRDLSCQNQPFHYSDNPTFLAEIASTFNECLLFDYMIKNSPTKKERKFFIFQYMSTIQATFFRQTMFASFEKDAHAMAEHGGVLTSTSLRKLYRKNLEDFLGGGMTIDDSLEVECLRIPHFYNPFYVFKYATSLCASIALSEMVLNGDNGAVEKYMKFLKSGSHKEPMEILKEAGVDLTKKKSYLIAVEKMRWLMEEYKKNG